MKTEFVKGRWYKSYGDYYLCSEVGNHVTCSAYVDRGWWNKNKAVFSPYCPVEEASPNEVLDSIKTEGLTPEQLKEIAEVFFVSGVEFLSEINAVDGGAVRPVREFQGIDKKPNPIIWGVREGKEGTHVWAVEGLYNTDTTACSNPSICLNGKWNTIIKHPAYGEQDLREYGKQIKGSGGFRHDSTQIVTITVTTKEIPTTVNSPQTETMNKTAALERLNAIEIEQKELRKILEQPEKPERWMPDLGEAYFFISRGGRVNRKIRDNRVDADFADTCDNFNIYPTKELAQKDADYYRTLRELRAFSDGLDGDYVILYEDSLTNKFRVAALRNYRFPFPRFKTKQRAEEAIKHFGDRLKLIYL